LGRRDNARGHDHLGAAGAEVDELDRRLARLDHRMLCDLLAEGQAPRRFDDAEVPVAGVLLAFGADHRDAAHAAGFEVEVDFLAGGGEVLGPPPLRDLVRIGPHLPDELAGGVELALDHDRVLAHRLLSVSHRRLPFSGSPSDVPRADRAVLPRSPGTARAIRPPRGAARPRAATVAAAPSVRG